MSSRVHVPYDIEGVVSEIALKPCIVAGSGPPKMVIIGFLLRLRLLGGCGHSFTSRNATRQDVKLQCERTGWSLQKASNMQLEA